MGTDLPLQVAVFAAQGDQRKPSVESEPRIEQISWLVKRRGVPCSVISARTNESGSLSTECATFREFAGGQIKTQRVRHPQNTKKNYELMS